MYTPELPIYVRNAGMAAAAAGTLLLGPIQPASAQEAHPSPDPTLSQEIGDPPSRPGAKYPGTLPTPAAPSIKELIPIPGLTRETNRAHAMPYAPRFTESTEALQITNGDLQTVTQALGRVTRHADPASTQVEIIGFASGEDDWSKPYAGITTPDQRNENLALARAEASASKLRQTIEKDPWLADVTVNVVGGREQQLSNKQAKTLDEYAVDQGFTNLSDMIVQYNDGATNPHVTQKLDEVIGPARGVEYRIKFKTVIPPVAADHQKHSNPKEPQPQPAEEPIQNPPGNITETKTGHLGDLAWPTTAVIGAAALLARRRGNKSVQNPEPTPDEATPNKILTPA